MTATKHGVHTEKEAIISMMRRAARASTAEKYQAAVKELKESTIWTKNKKLK